MLRVRDKNVRSTLIYSNFRLQSRGRAMFVER